MSDNKYKSASAFRTALENRLNAEAKASGSNIDYFRKFVAFEAFLKRITLYGASFKKDSEFRVVLKGGYAMFKRYGKDAGVRPTKDLDFVLRRLLSDSSTEYEKMVRFFIEDAIRTPVDDYFSFVVADAQKDLESAGLGGWRFNIDARVAGRTFVKFHTDMCLDDALMDETEKVPLGTHFEFAGLATVDGEQLSEAQHFAEKLHALTRDLGSVSNSRVKDLVDLVIMIKNGSLDPVKVAGATAYVFTHRNQHALPTEIPRPNANWQQKYADMVKELGLEVSYEEALRLVDAYYADVREIISQGTNKT